MNRYTMTFVFSPDLDKVLLLKKPANHPNVLFRNRWTAPGGRIEANETQEYSALRELKEETGLNPDRLTQVLLFACDCDPAEPEHFVWVYATRMPVTDLKAADGTTIEPVRLFATGEVLDLNRWNYDAPPIWTLRPLVEMCRSRLTQVPR